MITLFRGSHVHVVLEFPCKYNPLDEPTIHGVFSKREYALDKAKKLKTRHHKDGHIAVLKQKIKGAKTV